MFDYKGKSKFSSEDMLDYLENFDCIKEKYLIDDKSLLKKLARFEKYEQQGRLQKMPPSYIGKTVNSVYGLSYNTKMQTIQNFSIAWRKIINNFLNIKGLELLFNEHYYDFEWDMHLEIDFEKSSSTYYRDHMEHQIRNMYMMMVLLDKYGFLKTIKDILLNKSNSKVSDYVRNRYNNFIEENKFSEERREILLDCAKYYFYNQIKEFVTNNSIYKQALKENNKEKLFYQLISFFEDENFVDFNHKIRTSFFEFFYIRSCSDDKVEFCKDVAFSLENLKKWIETISEQSLISSYVKIYTICYIVRSAAIISALFHDISYPICFFLSMRERVGQYLPSMNSFTHNTEADIDRIVSLLQPSLLFVLVSESEIRSKLAKSQKKYDHGVLSAIALLLSFYESGKIHQLPIDKQISIELAALAIYNHNFSYYVNDINKKEYYRPVFQQNPISYLLKICDDMQEWDRRYFELSEKNSFTYCPICLSPIVKIKEYDDGNKIRESLLCSCTDKKYTYSQFFLSRNMYIVTTCKSIDICQNAKGDFVDLIFRLNYDLLDLLYMSQISTSYSTYRSKELSKLKILLLNQKYYSESGTKNKIDNIYLDYTMSNNPIFLKSKILLSYVLKTLDFNVTDFEISMDKIEDGVYNVFSGYASKLEKNLSTIDFMYYDTNHFYETFKSETLNLLKNEFLKGIKSKEKTLFCFWVYDLFSEVNSFSRCNFWDLFCAMFKKTYPYADHEEYFNYIKNTKWDEFYKSINEIIKENCCVVLVKKALSSSSPNSSLTKAQKTYRNKFIKLLEQKTCFYLELSGYIMKSMVDISLLPEEHNFIDSLYSLKFKPYEGEKNSFFELLNELLKDLYRVISNQVNIYSNFDINKYKNQYVSPKRMPHIVEKYCNPINWYDNDSESYIKFAFNNLDYHSDLLMFEVLGREIKSE